MFVKVCGLKTAEQIDLAIALGYDAIGVVTYKKSKRYCPPELAAELAAHAKGKILSFVVGVKYNDVKEAASAFDYTQIYEPLQVPRLALAASKAPPEDLEYDYFLYDASVGSGEFKAFPAWLKNCREKLVLAGGLTPDNVGSVIQEIQPFGVDVSSGVETDGVKDPRLMKLFIEAVRRNEIP